MDFVENVGRRSKVGGDQGDFINVGVFSLNGYERNMLYQATGSGQFADVAYLKGADRIEDGRGLGVLDVNGDGGLDLVIANYAMPARLLINHPAPECHWLELKLQGTRSNRSAIGARVEIQHGLKRQFRQVSTTGGYLSGQSLHLHFGLGLDRAVDRLIVRWPSGAVDELRDIPADGFYRIIEGESADGKGALHRERAAPVAAAVSGPR